MVPPEPLKFIRDAMIIKDIEGSQPIVKKKYAARDSLNVYDIEGAARRQPYERRNKGSENATYDNIGYTDVTKGAW